MPEKLKNELWTRRVIFRTWVFAFAHWFGKHRAYAKVLRKNLLSDFKISKLTSLPSVVWGKMRKIFRRKLSVEEVLAIIEEMPQEKLMAMQTTAND